MSLMTINPTQSTAPELFADVNAAPPRVISSAKRVPDLQDLMRDVIRRGTGRRALVLGRNGTCPARPVHQMISARRVVRRISMATWRPSSGLAMTTRYLPLAPARGRLANSIADLDANSCASPCGGAPENQMPHARRHPDSTPDQTSATGCPARAGQPNTTVGVFSRGSCSGSVTTLQTHCRTYSTMPGAWIRWMSDDGSEQDAGRATFLS